MLQEKATRVADKLSQIQIRAFVDFYFQYAFKKNQLSFAEKKLSLCSKNNFLERFFHRFWLHEGLQHLVLRKRNIVLRLFARSKLKTNRN